MGSFEDYTGGAADILDAAKEYGRTVKIIYYTQGVNEWDVPIPSEPKNINALVMGFKSFEIDGTLIKATDKKLIVAPAEIQPIIAIGGNLTGMSIVDGGETFSIINARTVAPGDVVIMYELQCRV